MPLVGEHPLLRDVKPAPGGVLAQRGELGADRLVLRLPGAGDPRLARRAVIFPSFAAGAVLARRCGTKML